MSQVLWILAAAVILDRLVGDPDWLWRRVPHPVVGFGKVISVGDTLLNREHWGTARRQTVGFAFIATCLLVFCLLGLLLAAGLRSLGWLGLGLELALVAVFLAHKSLSDHVKAVSIAYRTRGLDAGRNALSMIVGRDTSQLQERGVSRGAVESLAENFSDGVVAPAFWYAVGGLPGLLMYKFLNTADSMIGHRTDRHADFGRASAQLDDVANWLPARLSVLLIAVAAKWSKIGPGRRIIGRVLRDAGLHRSPNAGWPEAAFAAALSLQLGGSRSYRGEGAVAAPTLNASGRYEATIVDVDKALRLFAYCGNSLLVAVVLLAIVIA